MGLLLRTFLLVFVMELGSADQMVLMSSAVHSGHKLAIWASGMLAIGLVSLLSILAGDLVSRLPFSVNLVSGVLLAATGIILIAQR